MALVVMPLPSRDFDPSEVAISWRVLTAQGHDVHFATPDGAPAAADRIMLDGIGLDPWSRVPGLRHFRLIGLLLRANRDARQAYADLERDPYFRAPLRWDQALADDFDGLLLPGGHRARGMRDYLESAVLQRLVVTFFDADKPVGAICHGVLLAARSLRGDGKSVLYGRRTASLTWAQERAASALAHIGRRWDRDYYRTYVEEPGQPEGHMSVEAEVTCALAAPEDYVDVPRDAPDFRRKTSGLARDSLDDAHPAWVVRDGNYVSARWPGDAHTLPRASPNCWASPGAPRAARRGLEEPRQDASIDSTVCGRAAGRHCPQVRACFGDRGSDHDPWPERGGRPDRCLGL